MTHLGLEPGTSSAGVKCYDGCATCLLFAPPCPCVRCSSGCTNVTGWDVFPWMLASDNGGAYNTTVYLPQQKLLAGVWVLCYHFPGLGWRQIGHNFTVAGPLRFEWVPHTPKRRTFFPLLVYGVGLNATDEWALVFGCAAARLRACAPPCVCARGNPVGAQPPPDLWADVSPPPPPPPRLHTSPPPLPLGLSGSATVHGEGGGCA
jgi:hypothetical protein